MSSAVISAGTTASMVDLVAEKEWGPLVVVDDGKKQARKWRVIDHVPIKSSTRAKSL